MNQRPPSSRRRRKLGIAAGLFVAFTLFGFFGAPPLVKSQLEQRGSAALGRTVTVGKVRMNPFAMSLTLENLAVQLPEGEGSFLGWTRLYANFDPLSSLFGAWTLGSVELDGFHAAVVRRQDGTFDFDDIMARLKAASQKKDEPAGSPPSIRVERLSVQQARLDFLDLSQPQSFATTLGPVGFTLKDFHTTADRLAPYYFEAVTEAGEKLVWRGSLSAAPLASAGEVQVEGIRLPKYAPYFAHRVQADLTSGKLSVSGRYEAKFDGATRVLKLAGGAVQLRELNVVERAGQEVLLELPTLDVTGIDADAVAMNAQIATVTLTGGHVRVRREPDGSINFLNALRPSAAATPGPAAAPPTAPAALPQFIIGEVTLQDFRVDATDLAAPRPAQLGLTGIQFSLRNATLSDGAEMPLSLEFGWTPAGAVKVSGTATIKPGLKASLQVDVAALGLLPLSPYLEQFVNARLAEGTVSASGAAQLVPGQELPTAIFEGDLTLEKFGVVDEANHEELAGFGSLALNGLKVVTGVPLTVSLAEMAVTSPYARVLVNKEGVLNLATLAKSNARATWDMALPSDGSSETKPDGSATGEPAATPDAAAPAASGSLPAITVAKVTIAEGDFSFTDHSLEPNVRMAVSQFGGVIAGLSSEEGARAAVELKASVQGVGPVAITGQVAPLGAKKFIDLTVDTRNVDLLPLSPYSGKYAGYELTRGQLNLDVKATLDDRKLDATNVITLNQFTFGAPVASPVATKLPVRLGVALLKDSSGQIVIDVPMSGSIDDPSLRIGKVVWRVVGNLLTKAATSPFALLGSMFGGGGDELAFQEFEPGRSELLPSEAAKLATMTKALSNRPGLNLAIEGGFETGVDLPVLRRQKLDALVRGRIWEERRATDPNLPPPAQQEILPEAHAAMVRKLFLERFPTGEAVEAPLPPSPMVAASPIVEKKSLFRRVVDALKADSPPVAAAQSAADGAAMEGDEVEVGPSLEEMTLRLVGTMEVGDNDLRALADARAQRVRDYFINEGKIAADRLFLAQGNAVARENKGPRVFLSLQ